MEGFVDGHPFCVSIYRKEENSLVEDVSTILTL